MSQAWNFQADTTAPPTTSPQQTTLGEMKEKSIILRLASALLFCCRLAERQGSGIAMLGIMINQAINRPEVIVGLKVRERAPQMTWDISYATYVSRVVRMLQGKWTIPILCAVRTQRVRLSELRRAIPTASKKALTASLRSLKAANVVVRRDLSGSVLHVEYELVDTMRKPLVTLLDHLAEWGELYELEAQPTVAPDIDSLIPSRRIQRR